MAHARLHALLVTDHYGGFGPSKAALPWQRYACLFVRYKVCSKTNKPTPTAGPNTVAKTNIMNDFPAMILIPRTTRRSISCLAPPCPDVQLSTETLNNFPMTTEIYTRKIPLTPAHRSKTAIRVRRCETAGEKWRERASFLCEKVKLIECVRETSNVRSRYCFADDDRANACKNNL